MALIDRRAIDDLCARWQYTDREIEMFAELFRRVGEGRARKAVDYAISTHKQIERPTFQQISLYVETGRSELGSEVKSTVAPPPPGRELSKAESVLAWKWAGEMMTNSPAHRAAACKRYMEAATQAGHVWSERFKRIVFEHYERNVALAKQAQVAAIQGAKR